MNPIDNTNLVNYRADAGTVDFVPAVSYEYDASAKEVDITDDSTFPSGVALRVVHVKVHDKFGNDVSGFIYPVSGSDSGHDGETTIDVSGLDASRGLIITATVVANDGKLIADGSAHDIGAAGDLGARDKQKNA